MTGNLVQVKPPGDKSLTHRALILGALASGECTIVDPLSAEDTLSTASVLRSLGVGIEPFRAGETVTVEGVGLGGFAQPTRPLDCGNSGTAARLLLGVLAGSSVSGEITGDESLCSRPMRRVSEPLRQMGANIEELNGDGLPLRVRGASLQSIDYVSPIASAQVKSAILLAGLTGQVTVTVREPYQSRDHTERLLAALGVPIVTRDGMICLDPVDKIPSFTMRIPGDPSSSAFPIAAALLSSQNPIVVEAISLNPTRTAFLDVLRRMGASIQSNETSVELGEPVGNVTVTRSTLHATEVAQEEVPWLIDEIPVLACLASRADGDTVFRGVGELRVKESDRLWTITDNLLAIGGQAWVVGDDLYVRGLDVPYKGIVETALDHRIAMAFATLNVHELVDLQLSENHSPQISYPTFFEDLERVARCG